jgi:flagellar biogenesis protein FliO
MEQQDIAPIDLLDTASYLAILLSLLFFVLWVLRRMLGGRESQRQES